MVVNAANEVAVQAFLDEKIGFGEIAEIVAYALRNHDSVAADSVEVIEETDRFTREMISTNILSKR